MARDSHQRSKLFAGIFFIAIMVLSTIGFVFNFQTESSSFDYNGFEFAQRKNAWEVQVKNRPLLFGLHPSQLEGLKVDGNLSLPLTSIQQVYITYDSQSENKAALAEATFDFEQRLSNYAGAFAVSGISDPNGTSARGITCENATQSVPVVMFVVSNKTSITTNGTCITASANGEWDLLGVEERILYTAVGVMP